MIRCLQISFALKQDKRWDPTLGRSQSGEPQLIGEAIAAAMHNESLIVSCEISKTALLMSLIEIESTARRATSEPPTIDRPPIQTLPMSALSTSDVSLPSILNGLSHLVLF
jgi:hypothetical protein